MESLLAQQSMVVGLPQNYRFSADHPQQRQASPMVTHSSTDADGLGDPEGLSVSSSSSHYDPGLQRASTLERLSSCYTLPGLHGLSLKGGPGCQINQSAAGYYMQDSSLNAKWPVEDFKLKTSLASGGNRRSGSSLDAWHESLFPVLGSSREESLRSPKMNANDLEMTSARARRDGSNSAHRDEGETVWGTQSGNTVSPYLAVIHYLNTLYSMGVANCPRPIVDQNTFSDTGPMPHFLSVTVADSQTAYRKQIAHLLSSQLALHENNDMPTNKPSILFPEPIPDSRKSFLASNPAPPLSWLHLLQTIYAQHLQEPTKSAPVLTGDVNKMAGTSTAPNSLLSAAISALSNQFASSGSSSSSSASSLVSPMAHPEVMDLASSPLHPSGEQRHRNQSKQ